MSLACSQCNKDMGPSEELPGREGTMVFPVLMSLVYLPLKEGEPSYETKYIVTPAHMALCFDCIEKALPSERMGSFKKIYETYELETTFRRIDENQKGRWLSSEDIKPWREAYDKFNESFKKIESGCLFCGNNVENGKPFFIPRTIDKVYSEKNLSGIFQFTNYSFSNMKEGITAFRICFDDFRKSFPKTFENLSYMLLGKRNPNSKPKPGEIYLTQEFEKALERQTGKTIDDFLNEEIKKGNLNNLRIIRRSKD